MKKSRTKRGKKRGHDLEKHFSILVFIIVFLISFTIFSMLFLIIISAFPDKPQVQRFFEGANEFNQQKGNVMIPNQDYTKSVPRIFSSSYVAMIFIISIILTIFIGIGYLSFKKRITDFSEIAALLGH